MRLAFVVAFAMTIALAACHAIPIIATVGIH